MEKKKATKKKTVKQPKISKKEQEIIELSNHTTLPDYYESVQTVDQLKSMCDKLSRVEEYAIDTETTGLEYTDRAVGFSIYFELPLGSTVLLPFAYYVPIEHETEKVIDKQTIIDMMRPHFTSNQHKILHNSKFDRHKIATTLGIELENIYWDTSIASHLLDERVSHSLKDLAVMYKIKNLRGELFQGDKYGKLFDKVPFSKVPLILATKYAGQDPEMTYKLYQFQYSHLAKRSSLADIYKLFREVEMPFLESAYQAEKRGMVLDVDYLQKKVDPELTAKINELKSRIVEQIGHDINLNSPQQLAAALFDELQLPQINGRSTDGKKVLKILAKEHQVVRDILEYKQTFKLWSAFVQKLPLKVDENGVIHTSFNTLGAKTGRLSSSGPKQDWAA